MFFNNITPVVKNLIILNVAMWVITTVLVPGLWTELSIYYPETESFRPYQIATYMFLHDASSIFHILFNMMFLAFAGSRVEYLWGAQRFLFYYLFCGVAALVLHFGMIFYQVHYQGMPLAAAEYPMLGASGAVYGVIGAFGFLFAEETIQLMFPPIPMKIKYLVMLMVGGQLMSGFGGSGDNIAHLAHASGALFGLLLIFYWNKGGKLGRF
jgi:membrane associated rhomboid family serine protease